MKGWQTKTLGEVLEKTATANPLLTPEAEFDYIDVSSVSNESFQIEETQRLLGKDAPSRARKQVRTNDLIFATIRPTLRRIAIVPEKFDQQVCSTGYFVLRPKPLIDYRFMYHWLFSAEFMGQMEALQKGASYPAVTDAEVRAQKIPFPPLPEQHRIVAILDAAFDHIATARANCEANLLNVRAIFESHLQAVFTERGDGWEEKNFGDIATFRNGINFTKSSKGDSIRILGVKDFQSHFWAPMDDLDFVIPDGKLPDSDTLLQDDLVFVRSNGNPELIGRCLLVPEASERTTHSGFTIRARLTSSVVLPIYLCHFLKSSVMRREMIDGGNGVNIRSLNQGTLAGLAIPLPSLALQTDIVRQIDALKAETQRLESLYQRKLQALDDLEKSLLHQAFSGLL